MSLSETPHGFTPSDRIKQLNDIDRDVAQLLRSAGSALTALNNKPAPTAVSSSPSATQEQEPITPESQRTAFSSAATQYFSLLSSIDVRLRRQVYALEEAEIIAPDALGKEVQTSFASTASGTTGSKSSVYGGQGSLEVGTLNSRKDRVGKEMERELWREARELVEKLETGGLNGETREKEDDDMEVDPTTT